MGLSYLFENSALGKGPVTTQAVGGTQPMEPKVPQYDLPPTPLEAQRQFLLDLIANPPQKPAKKPRVKAAYRTEDAVKGGLGLILSGLLGGEKAAAGFAQGYAGAKNQEAQAKQQDQDEEGQDSYAEKVKQYNAQLASAKTVLDFMEQDEAKAERSKTQDQKQADDLRNDFRMMYQMLNQEMRLTKSKDRMQQIGAQMRYIEDQLGLPKASMDEATIDRMWMQQSSEARNKAIDNYRLQEDQYLKRYGYVPDELAGGLEQFRRQTIAEVQSYGLKDFTLPPVSTEKTLQFKAAEEKKREFEARLKQQANQHTDRMAESKANRAVRREFLRVASRNSDTARMNYLLRLMDDDASKVNKEADKAIKAYDKKLEELNGQLNSKSSSGDYTLGYDRRQQIKAQIDGINRAKAYVESQRETTEKNAPNEDRRSIERKIADFPDKARGNAALRAIRNGADPNAVFQRLIGG